MRGSGESRHGGERLFFQRHALILFETEREREICRETERMHEKRVFRGEERWRLE